MSNVGWIMESLELFYSFRNAPKYSVMRYMYELETFSFPITLGLLQEIFLVDISMKLRGLIFPMASIEIAF